MWGEVKMAYDYLLELTRGDDHTFEVSFVDELGAPLPITGWAFKSTIKGNTALDDSDATVTVDIPPVSGPMADAGILQIPYPHEQTANLLPGENYVDVQCEVDGKVTTYVSGKILVHPDVTRRVG